MKKGYNFKINSDINIELILKDDKNVIISQYDIENIEVKAYKSPLKKMYKLISKMNLTKSSNFCYDISEIKLTLKDSVDLDRNLKEYIFYNIFNLKRFNLKKEKNCMYLYEIMYDKKSDNNIEYIKNYKELRL